MRKRLTQQAKSFVKLLIVQAEWQELE